MPDDDVLTGARVVLRAPRIEDAGELFASVTSDPRVTEYLSWTPHADADETRRVIRELFNVGNDHTWVIVLRETGEIVGELGYRGPLPHTAEIGYCMAVNCWGRGLMREAVGVALQRLQQDSRLRWVTAAVHTQNTRSARVLEKCGFTLEGTVARHTVFPNLNSAPQDCLFYRRTLP
jgi:ribosomal-protein-alanine N-acetyltransferase